MTQPNYVPLPAADLVRTAERLPPQRGWVQNRPGDVLDSMPSSRPHFGTAGPDQGYGLKLARRLAPKLELAGEHLDDVIAGGHAVAERRAALNGRAPIIFDYELAFTLWGYLGNAPADLAEFRRPLFAEASHDYWAVRRIADLVPDATLRMTPTEVRNRLRDWRTLVNAAATA